MRKGTLIGLIVLIGLVAAFGWAQNKIRFAREGIRVEEKILMLSNKPAATKIMALGFDGALSDILWIRAIQYFGGNFSSLNKPEKREGMENLFENMFTLDPKFIAAYLFSGFVVNESMKDPNLAVDYLLRGADANPWYWKLPFDAGFIAFYQMQNYELAKSLFIRSAYGEAFPGVQVTQSAGVQPGFEASFLVDGDPNSEAYFAPAEGSVTFDLDQVKKVGRINVRQNGNFEQHFRLTHSPAESQPFSVINEVTKTNFTDLIPPLDTQFFTMDQMETRADDGLFKISDVEFYGPRDKATPTYVDRMAIEMERNSGRFSAAWNQYVRYYEEAVKKGDQTSAELALDKLESIYNAKAREILSEAVELYKADHQALPSSRMLELVEQGYLQRVLDQKNAEDPNFEQEVMQVLFKSGDLRQILLSFDGQSPSYLLTYAGTEDQTDWYIANRKELQDQQETMLKQLQILVDKFKEEKGTWPAALEDVKQLPDVQGDSSLFEDPLRGQFVLNQQTHKVEAVNPQL